MIIYFLFIRHRLIACEKDNISVVLSLALVEGTALGLLAGILLQGC